MDGSNGRPLAGQTVTFTVAAGGGSIAPGTAVTDQAGLAQTSWTLGNTVGVQTLNASVASLTPLTISATVTPGRAAAIAVQAGNNQTATVGGTVNTRPSVIVRDAGNNPVAGAQVLFTVGSGGGTITGELATTDQSGVATLGSWQLGSTAGANTLVARVIEAGTTQGPSVTFTATGTAGAAFRLEASAGSDASGPVGSELPANARPAVTVRDASNNPISGVPVTFTVVSGGGTISGTPTVTTNAQGLATIGGFTPGATAGPNVVRASATGLPSVTFTITGTPGAAAVASAVATTNNQEVRAGQVVAQAPSVLVVDRFGNPVPGVTVTFRTGSGGGSITGTTTATTNAQGVATVSGFRTGATPGTNTLIASVAGAADVTITATGLAGPPTQILTVSGNEQSVVAFRSAAQPMVVRVLDADNFPVRGATVTFALAASGGGSLSATSVQTDANGRASTTFTANGTLGVNTVTARVGNLTPVEFTVTTTPNAAASVISVGPQNQTATAGTAVASPPTVRLRDAANNAVPGVTVFFTPYPGSGTVQNTSAVTNANGEASAGAWFLSNIPGVNSLAATVNVAGLAGNPVVFTATGLEVPAGATITPVPGLPPATAPAGTTVAAAVLVRTAGGVALPGLSVDFVVTSGGGNIGGQSTVRAVTDASGVARVNNWTLGGTVSTTNTLSATIVNGQGTVITVVTNP